MTQSIFRQAALDRLASPERLDRPARLVGAPAKLLLLAVLLGLAAAAGFAAFARAPVVVAAEGVLIDRGGLVEIAADRGGRIETLALEPGALVEAGAVVATLGQAELRRELEAAESRRADAAARLARFEAFHAEQAAREAEADAARRETIGRALGVLGARVLLLDERAAKTQELYERQVVVRDRLIETEIDASDAKERISVLEEEALRLDLAAVERESARRIALLDEALKVEEAEREAARLRARLAESLSVRAPRAGRVVEIKVNAGDVIAAGAALATLAPPGGGELEAVLYAPPGEGKRIEPGMRAEISPVSVEREVYGFIRAEVAAVAPLPATPEGMRRTLQNDQLVRQLSAAGAPIEVRLRLERDPAAPTGFAWSASAGPPRGVGPGALVRARVVVDEAPLIDLLLPGLAGRLGLAP